MTPLFEQGDSRTAWRHGRRTGKPRLLARTSNKEFPRVPAFRPPTPARSGSQVAPGGPLARGNRLLLYKGQEEDLLLQGDCKTVLKDFFDDTVDLIVTSPL